ncbi:MAG: amidohydrolase family protein, partial [Gammaproteobacteria bacterium]|nr:amidohydrolase family protein [Gammaproteobacteria bacterium]
MKQTALVSSILLVAVACGQSQVTTYAHHVFVGEHIITMQKNRDDAAPTALAVIDDEIVWLGREEDADQWIGPGTEVHRLGKRALMPGFIDAHGHLTYLAATLNWANLASPPVGSVTGINSLQTTLTRYIAVNAVPPGAWVIGNGYDDSLITEQRHPTRDDLDEVSSVHPIALIHVSGHLMAVNSRALDEAGIASETVDPPGGHIRRYTGSRRPNGVLEESATYPIRALLQQPSLNPVEDLNRALALYAGYGITTVQDGAISPPAIELLERMDAEGALTLDVVVYPIVRGVNDKIVDALTYGRYRNRLKFGGVKM